MSRLSKQWIRHNQAALYAVTVFLAVGIGLGVAHSSSTLELLIERHPSFSPERIYR